MKSVGLGAQSPGLLVGRTLVEESLFFKKLLGNVALWHINLSSS